MILQRCTHPRPCYDDGKCHYKGECSHKAPLTNADRIRDMSDKELAELMRSIMGCDSCGKMFSFKCDGSYEHCLSVCLKWLQQPAKEDDYEF